MSRTHELLDDHQHLLQLFAWAEGEQDVTGQSSSSTHPPRAGARLSFTAPAIELLCRQLSSQSE